MSSNDVGSYEFKRSSCEMQMEECSANLARSTSDGSAEDPHARGGTGWEARSVVFYEGLRLWEAHLYVFYVSGRLSGGLGVKRGLTEL